MNLLCGYRLEGRKILLQKTPSKNKIYLRIFTAHDLGISSLLSVAATSEDLTTILLKVYKKKSKIHHPAPNESLYRQRITGPPTDEGLLEVIMMTTTPESYRKRHCVGLGTNFHT
jgi:hypothetical protein